MHRHPLERVTLGRKVGLGIDLRGEWAPRQIAAIRRRFALELRKTNTAIHCIEVTTHSSGERWIAVLYCLVCSRQLEECWCHLSPDARVILREWERLPFSARYRQREPQREEHWTYDPRRVGYGPVRMVFSETLPRSFWQRFGEWLERMVGL